MLSLIELREKLNVVLLSQLKHGSVVFADPGGPYLYADVADFVEPGIVALDFVLFDGLADAESADASPDSILRF